MGFLDNVRDALKDALSTQASKEEKVKPDDVVVDEADTTTAADSATPAPPTIPTPEPTLQPTPEPVQPADSVTPTPTDTAEEKVVSEGPAEARGAKFETYTVKSGDTLSEIGARFGVSSQEIAKLNGIENPDLIFPGQVFRIPLG